MTYSASLKRLLLIPLRSKNYYLFNDDYGRRLDYDNKEFYVLVAAKATEDPLRAFTPHNVHWTFSGAHSVSPFEFSYTRPGGLKENDKNTYFMQS